MSRRIHPIVTTDAEIDAAIAESERHPLPVAVSATFVGAEDAIAIQFADGVQIHIPRRLLQGLEDATPQQLGRMKLEGPGTGLAWPALGVAHYIPGVIDGLFGTRRWMAEIGRRGGFRRTKAKATAARANGAKGGRPPATSSRKRTGGIQRRSARS
jgi:hypothetical protein